MAEIIDIVSDEEIIEPPRKKVFRCLNPDCRKDTNLIHASKSMKRYYGTLAYKKKTKICNKCSEHAILIQEKISNSVRIGEILISNPDVGNKNMVVVSDSESDPSDSDSESDKMELELDPEEVEQDSNHTICEETSKENWKELVAQITDDLGLKKQVVVGTQLLKNRLLQSEKGFQELETDFKNIEKDIDSVRNSFYDSFKPEIQFLTPLDTDTLPESLPNAEVTEVTAESSHYCQQLLLPPDGPIDKPELKPFEYVFSIKHSLFSKWVQAVIISMDRKDANIAFYNINYGKQVSEHSSNVSKLVVSAKNLAYFNACPTRIPVGTRVIAKYKDEENGSGVYTSVGFYVGIVAEIPTLANKYRYLIFFDDGYAQYVNHHDIRLVVESSEHAWEDVASDSREFIKDYLFTYPERPMVRLQKWNYIKTEWSGKWYKAQVLEVDGSLVKMFFPMDRHTEWVYRGSTRLSPLFNKKINIQSKFQQQSAIIRRRTMPFNRQGPVVEYINTDQFKEQESAETEPSSPPCKLSPKPEGERRAVARKSTSGRPGTPPLEVQELINQESKGIIKRVTVPDDKLTFVPHQCSSSCLVSETDSNIVSPLVKPLLNNWHRHISRQKKKTFIRNSVTYVAPCGRRLRSIEDIFRYLRITNSKLEIDYFSYDCGLAVATEWEPSKKNFSLVDISTGVETVPITCVNSIDLNVPSPLIYCNTRQPTEKVPLNLDPSFLVCCNCDDDCQDKNKCECWQLTIKGAKVLEEKYDDEVGYQYRRLLQQVPTGIYECNSLCSCKKSCLNKVVQNPIRYKLQLFKTVKRGWAVRTLHDIPQGGFICHYVGKLLSEAEANQEGKISGGDDYYAELDFIEVAEGLKEGYESDIELDDSDDPWTKSDSESSGPIMIRSIFSDLLKANSSCEGQKITQRKMSISSDSPSEEESSVRLRQKQTFEPNLMAGPSSGSGNSRSVRELYGIEEAVYIIDAKVTGNVGRYFNHSCQPNVFVQNVFVDTHDVRFPWVAFFASTRIRAGVELTWDYNYEVGSVQGKIKYCYCMAKKCRGRLL